MTHAPPRIRDPLPAQIGLGLLAAALFSVTFVLNRAMSLQGGPWVWTAALRYADMAALLGAWIALRQGVPALLRVTRVFAKRPAYWLLAGGVGFGVFYAGICFASVHAPGWMVAATWQSTILATPLVLRAMGQRVPLRGVASAAVIFVGLLLITAQSLIDGVTAAQWRLGVLPVLVAAFAYPFGNQLLNRARHATDADADADTAAVLADPVASVLLLTLGSLPVLALLVLIDLPPLPTSAQLMNTLIVALVAGVIATTLFLHARNLSAEPYRIAAVDATQGGEVVFALLGEMLLLGAPAPSPLACLGLVLMLCGLVGFALGSSGGKKLSH